MLNPQELSSLIKLRSLDLGFDHCGIARAAKLSKHESRLKEWLKNGLHSDMEYMERNLDKRLDPTMLVEGARSVVVVAMNYFQEYTGKNRTPGFSKYACGGDCHKIIKDKLYLLFEEIKKHNENTNGRVFVDSAPVLERAWAVEAGLGWPGKNSMLINRDSGSYLFLGTMLIDIELVYDEPAINEYCGSCTLCIEACPTGAITEFRSIDSSRCISYLSIEKRGEFAPGKNINLHGYVFGCDICQDVCPWNRKASPTSEEAFSTLPEIENFSYENWKEITEDEFNSIFRNSPVLRTGYKGFMRNLRYL